MNILIKGKKSKDKKQLEQFLIEEINQLTCMNYLEQLNKDFIVFREIIKNYKCD